MNTSRRHGLGGRGRSALFALFALPACAFAQLTNDEVPIGRIIPLQTKLESEMESRFRLGSVRLLPQLIIVGPTYDNNVLGATGSEPKVSDWSLTASAGLGVLVPLGRKIYLRGDLFPEYIYYNRLTDHRQWGGTYGGSLYGFFNRMSFEADYKDQRTPQYPNTEIQTQVLGDTQAGDVKVEVDLGGPWSVYANGEYQQIAFRSLGAPGPAIVGILALLNRNEGAVRGGVRYRLARYFTVGLGAEETRTRFDLDPQRANNTSTAVVATMHYDRPRLYVSFSGGYREGRALDGSNFPDFNTFTGSGYLSYEVINHVSLNIYGQRAINYGLYPDNPYYLGSIGGGGLSWQLGTRITINGYGGYGTNTYPVPIAAADNVKRVDKVTTYGGGVHVALWRTISFTAQASSTDYNSNIALFDRNVFRFSSGFVIGLLTSP